MDNQNESFICIPIDQLSDEAFQGLVEEFVLREGTDYGHSEDTLEEKKLRITRQLEAGHIKIVYSSLTSDCTLLKSSELPSLG